MRIFSLLTSLIITLAISSATSRADNVASTSESTSSVSQEKLERLAQHYLELANQSDALFALFGKTRDQLRNQFSNATTIMSTGIWNVDATEYSIPLQSSPGVHYEIYKFTFDKDGRVNSIKRSKSGREGFSESKYTSREQIIKENLKEITAVIELSQNASLPVTKAFTQDQKEEVRVYAYAKRGIYHLLLGDRTSGLNDIATSERLRNDYGMGPIEQLNF